MCGRCDWRVSTCLALHCLSAARVPATLAKAGERALDPHAGNRRVLSDHPGRSPSPCLRRGGRDARARATELVGADTQRGVQAARGDHAPQWRLLHPGHQPQRGVGQLDRKPAGAKPALRSQDGRSDLYRALPDRGLDRRLAKLRVVGTTGPLRRGRSLFGRTGSSPAAESGIDTGNSGLRRRGSAQVLRAGGPPAGAEARSDHAARRRVVERALRAAHTSSNTGPSPGRLGFGRHSTRLRSAPP